MTRSLFSLLMVALVFLSSCKTEEKDNREEMARRSSVRDAVTVSTVELTLSTFYHELVSNGKVYAKNITSVPFKVEGTIEKIFVKNGEKVVKGQALAKIEDFKYNLQLERAHQQKEKAEILFKDQLLSNQGKLDTAGINQDKLKIFLSKSGMIDADLAVKEAEFNFTHTKIVAPISGLIANLKAKELNQTGKYSDGFCMVIDNSVLEIKFPILESEFSFVEAGMSVTVLPFVDNASGYTAIVSNINPIVDENGMIEVTAEMRNSQKLLEGMNVKIKIRKPVPSRLVIPKEALVIRQSRDVVFVREDSLAIWKYVTTEFENSESFSISEGLEEGDFVIFKGNVNLAHETIVKEEKK
ncbi:MAG: efflux RND transporter periplasmic adaptor subunit [Bacteroidales bacterium]|nr:efflux RND transporter periplasmic adaptor subunit [Bacteroidales bacterium]